MRSMTTLTIILLFASFAQASPSRLELDQKARAFIEETTAQTMWPYDTGFLKTAKTITYYSISKYYDYISGTVSPRMIGVYEAKDERHHKPISFGIIFDEAGKPLQLVGTSPNEEECLPYFIFDPKTYSVYYTAEDRSNLSALTQTRNRVLESLQQTLAQQKLATGFESVTMRLEPNEDRYEPQDAFVITNGMPLYQARIKAAMDKVKVRGVDGLFVITSRIGNPTMNPFEPEGNAVCSEVR